MVNGSKCKSKYFSGLEEVRTTLELERSKLQNVLKESETGGEHVIRELKTTEAQLKRERASLEQLQHDAKELQARFVKKNILLKFPIRY